MSDKVTMERKVGRLIEIRVPRVLTADLLQSALGRYEELVNRGTERVFMCTDERALKVHSPEAAEALLRVWEQRDPRIQRNAILVLPDAIVQLQVRRMITGSGNPDRRMFDDPQQLHQWLGADMTSAEQKRLSAFIGELGNGSET